MESLKKQFKNYFIDIVRIFTFLHYRSPELYHVWVRRVYIHRWNILCHWCDHKWGTQTASANCTIHIVQFGRRHVCFDDWRIKSRFQNSSIICGFCWTHQRSKGPWNIETWSSVRYHQTIKKKVNQEAGRWHNVKDNRIFTIYIYIFFFFGISYSEIIIHWNYILNL